jgi:futalosine hydrolase
VQVLLAVSVDAERQAVEAALPPGAPVRVVVTGVGPAEAAAAVAVELAAAPADLVVSAGIAGGFGGLGAGEIAVASSIVFADLGAETADGFLPLPRLGFGRAAYEVPAKLAVQLADRTGGRLGTVLTVATVTGSSATAAALTETYPDAVAAAADRVGVPVAEIRAISNAVGPRDRAAWRVDDALTALGAAVAAAFPEEDA